MTGNNQSRAQSPDPFLFPQRHHRSLGQGRAKGRKPKRRVRLRPGRELVGHDIPQLGGRLEGKR